MDEETLKDISRMCEIILGNTFGNRELDSLALYVGHHPLILNPGNAQNEMRRALEFGIHYGWNTPTIEPEIDGEAWVEFMESGSKEGE